MIRSQEDLQNFDEAAEATLMVTPQGAQLIALDGAVPPAMRALLQDWMPGVAWPVSRPFDQGYVVTFQPVASGGTLIGLTRKGRLVGQEAMAPEPLAGLRAPRGATQGESALLLQDGAASQTQIYVIPADVEFARRHYVAEMRRAGFQVSSFDNDGSVMLDGHGTGRAITVFLYADPVTPGETTAILTLHR